MFIVETIKQTIEGATGLGRPSREEAYQAVRKTEPKRFLFPDDGVIPNNPTHPMLVYRHAVRLDEKVDPAAVFEQLFAANHWGDSWRNGIYDYAHYHSSTHEVLGIARGSARVRFGGRVGAELSLAAGDVAVLPAGTGHRRLSGSSDLLVVGAYPPDGDYDECRGLPGEHARALRSIPSVSTPERDPVFGRTGPLTRLWKD